MLAASKPRAQRHLHRARRAGQDQVVVAAVGRHVVLAVGQVLDVHVHIPLAERVLQGRVQRGVAGQGDQIGQRGEARTHIVHAAAHAQAVAQVLHGPQERRVARRECGHLALGGDGGGGQLGGGGGGQ